jgi:hypothetical protein
LPIELRSKRGALCLGGFAAENVSNRAIHHPPDFRLARETRFWATCNSPSALITLARRMRGLRLGAKDDEGAAMTIRALVSADRPVVRIWSPDDPSRYVELRFESQEAANTAVEQLNGMLKYATGLEFGEDA